jgi:hypothetical protein
MAKARIPVDVVHPRWGRIETVLIVDPSPKDLKRWFDQNPNGQIRGVAARGSCYVFDAYTATHTRVREVLGFRSNLSEGCDFWVVPEGEEIISPEWDTDGVARDGLTFVKGTGNDRGIEMVEAWFLRPPTDIAVNETCPSRTP